MTTRIAILFLLFVGSLALASAPVQGQVRREGPPVSGSPEAHVQVYAYTLRHKPAGEALLLIRPLLTPRGTLELQPRTNTLVVRDTLAALGRIVPTLRAYDRPPEDLRLQMMIVRAYSRPVPGAQARSLPSWLEERLRGLLRWDYYQVLAESGVNAREGQDVAHEVGDLYGVSFRVGSVFPDERVKLHDFKIWRAGAGGRSAPRETLLEATLNLWLEKPKVLGLANSESSDHALMVVITCARPDRTRGRPQVSGEVREPPGGGD